MDPAALPDQIPHGFTLGALDAAGVALATKLITGSWTPADSSWVRSSSAICSSD